MIQALWSFLATRWDNSDKLHEVLKSFTVAVRFWRCFSYRADHLQEPRAVLSAVQSASGVRNRVKSGTKCQVVIEAAKTHVSPAMQSIYFYKLTITDHSSSNLQVGIYIYIYIFWVFGCDEPELLYEFMRDPLGGWKKKLSIAETGNRERGN